MKRKYFKFATSPVTASYAYLESPDTGGEYSDGKYKVTVILDADDEDVSRIREVVRLAAEWEWGDSPPANLHSPLFHPKGEDGEPDEKRWAFRLKSKDQPLRTDSRGAPLPPDIQIRSGDLVRLAGAASSYVSGANHGVTLYLNAVRLMEKRVGGDPFGGADVDGFVVEPSSDAGAAQTSDSFDASADINF